MSTTSAYGWNIPDNTDLVKDGALAIRTLGNAIDTSMNTALGTKKAGMVLLNTTSFSGVASQSIDSVFSSAYQNYTINFSIATVSSTVFRVRFRTGGVTNTSSTYNYQQLSYNSTTLTGARSLSDNNFKITYNNNNDHGGNILLLNPFDSTKQTFGNARVTGGADANLSDCKFAATTSFDGILIYPDAGNMTGTVSIFGFNN